MSRPAKLLLTTGALIAVVSLTSACGTENISVPKSAGPLYTGAVLFNQRCSGCHTLSFAATHGSAANIRSSEFNNGPDFDIRCERPETRVLYAIENGGFSGAIMPQNIVVGQDAIDVAKFVATYSGRQAPKIVGNTPCIDQPLGSIPAPVAAATTSTTATTATTSTTATTATTSTTATTPAKTSASPAKTGAKTPAKPAKKKTAHP